MPLLPGGAGKRKNPRPCDIIILMRNVIIAAFLALMFLVPARSYGFAEKLGGCTEQTGACTGDCRSCHSLKTSEAQSILSSFNPNLKVVGVKLAGVGGLWEITFEYGGRKNLVYVDFAKKHLIQGTVIDIKTKENLTDVRVSDLNRVDVSKIPLADALVIGNANAPLKVIVFDDPV